MRKQRLAVTGLAGVLSAGLLSGCIFGFAPVQFLPREAFASVNQVALAVGADGIKHYAWTECSGEDEQYTCVLIYVRTATGGVIYSYGFVQAIGTFVQDPDVAVTDSGDAYVVRSICDAPFDCVDYWSMFPADNPESVEPATNLLHTSAVNSEDPPLVVARGDDVYAAYFVEVGGHVRLRYRQLSGDYNRTGLIDNADLFPVSPSLAVDSDGDLHAVWVRNPITDTTVAYANNKGGVSNFNAAAGFEAGGDDELISITRPDVALDSDDRPYLAYTLNSGADDDIRVRCLAAVPGECWRGAILMTIPQVDGGWNIYRNVDLELIGPRPNVVFAATHSSLTHNEVWWFNPPSTGDIDPVRVTDTTNENEGAPRIVKENSTAGDVPVVGWRTYTINAAASQAPSGSPGTCFGDVFVMFYSTSNIRQVFDDRGTCANSGADLAANGAWVAGVWTDEESAQITSHAAWTTFNTERVNLPLVRR